MSLPNQQRQPLTRDERVAQSYQDRPGRLLDLAQLTGNKSLVSLALGMIDMRKRARKARR